MDATKRLLKSYQNASVNLRKVADEIERRGGTQAQIDSSRGRAYVYETVANEIALALVEDGALREGGS
jgi:hypothetical protein